MRNIKINTKLAKKVDPTKATKMFPAKKADPTNAPKLFPAKKADLTKPKKNNPEDIKKNGPKKPFKPTDIIYQKKKEINSYVDSTKSTKPFLKKEFSGKKETIDMAKTKSPVKSNLKKPFRADFIYQKKKEVTNKK
jgi:hypothetical protein